MTITLGQWTSAGIFKLTGALTGNHQLILPLSPNSVGSATAVGGKFVIDNETSGAFTVTVITAATSSTGVTVAQGSRTGLYSDSVNVWYADDSRTAKLNSFAGNPNTNVAGSAATLNNPADVVFDRTNNILYVCITTGNAASAVWASVGGAVPQPGGYLTPTSGMPIISADVNATSIFYTPYKTNQIPLTANGTTFTTFNFSELTLALSATQAASGIFDVFVFLNAGVVTIAFGPSWLAGAVPGNVTPGSCARGTGAGSSNLQRVAGILVNAVQIPAANNGASTFNIPANQGTYVGSVFVDAAAGQVTCHRTYGQSRKFGVWNAFNRSPILLQGGDGTGTWTYAGSGVWRQSNGAAANQLLSFTGLAEEEIEVDFRQNVVGSSANPNVTQVGIGINSTTVPSGYSAQGSFVNSPFIGGAHYVAPPGLGINNINMIEVGNSGGGGAATFKGTQANMLMTARYNG